VNQNRVPATPEADAGDGRAGRPSTARYGVLGFTLSLVGLAYLDRVCIATAAPVMRAELGLSEVQMGLVFSAFTLAYALFEVPSGWFADRYGPRLTIARIVVWWSMMTVLTGVASGFLSLVAIRLLFGVGEAGTFPATTRVYSRWLAPTARGGAFGLAIMAGALSGAVTQPLVVMLLDVIHWRHTFTLFGVVGMVWAAAWWWWFRDDPRQHRAVNEAELRLISGLSDGPARKETTSPTASSHRSAAVGHGEVPWGRLLRNPTMVALCGMYAGAIYGWYFYLTWLPTYLFKERGFDLKAAGWLAALPYVGIAVGVLAGGWLSDRLVHAYGARRGRRLPGLIGFPLAALAIVIAVVTADGRVSALALAAAACLAAMGVAPAWVICLEIGGKHAGVVSGAMNMFGNLGGALSPVVIGYGVEHLGAWNVPLLTLALCYLLAAVCWLAVDPARSIAVE
jgi:MFS transporter, ACS family, glucarate transporter